MSNSAKTIKELEVKWELFKTKGAERVEEFVDSLPEDADVYITVVKKGDEDKVALLSSNDFKLFLKERPKQV